MILIISADEDVHAQAVQSKLKILGEQAIILDLREFPSKSNLSIEPGNPQGKRVWHYRDSKIDLRKVKAVWWRRPQAYGIDNSITDPASNNFVLHECEELIQGLWLSLDAFWINIPSKDERAARKLWQLDVAQRSGLQTPRTLITNDPEDAKEFINVDGPERTVYKAFQGTEDTWRETRVLKPDEVKQLDSVRFAPVIFQEYIDAVYDIRVTIVGEQIFAAAIYSQETSYRVDFRMQMENVKIEAITLPSLVTNSLKELMHRLGLVYGAIDLRLTPEGKYVFLEINPAGQWLFVEDKTQQPISTAIAKLMSEKNRRGQLKAA